MKILFITAVVNFGIFGCCFFVIGGSAVGGKIDGGRFHVRNKSALIEVPPRVYCYSYAHTMLTAALFLAVFGVAAWEEAGKFCLSTRTRG